MWLGSVVVVLGHFAGVDGHNVWGERDGVTLHV